MLRYYGIDCKCKACNDHENEDSFAYKSSQRRWTFRNGQEVCERNSSSDEEEAGKTEMSIDSRLQLREDMISSMSEEVKYHPIMLRSYLDIADIYHQKQDRLNSVKAARRVLHMSTICQGAENPWTRRIAGVLEGYEKSLTPKERVEYDEWSKSL